MATQTLEELIDQAKDCQKTEQLVARREATRKRRNRERAEKYIFPLMPRTLTQMFRLTRVSYAYGINLTFELAKPDPNEKEMQRALGTVTKVETALKESDNIISVREGAARVKGYDPATQNITVEVAATLVAEKMTGVPVSISFDGFGKETPNCKLVEKEVIIEAQPRRYEKQMVVECNDND